MAAVCWSGTHYTVARVATRPIARRKHACALPCLASLLKNVKVPPASLWGSSFFFASLALKSVLGIFTQHHFESRLGEHTCLTHRNPLAPGFSLSLPVWH